MWQNELAQTKENIGSVTAIDLLAKCNKDIYNNIYVLLKLFVILPVTTCTTERSNSTLKRLKSYLRNSMGENRLTGLALMNIHYSHVFDIDDIINQFANKNRRLNFNLKL